MAIEAAERPPSTPSRRALGHGTGRDRPAGGLELWSWLFMRVSGVVLLFLAVGHVLIMHVFDGGVSRVNFGFVAVRWQSPFWRTWDWALLSLALVHGVNGLRVISLDYIRRPGVRIATNWFFATAGVLAFSLGSIVVFTFNPCRWPGTVGIHC